MIKNFSKLLGAATIVLFIWASLLVFFPSTENGMEVSTAEADILASFGAPSHREAFVDSLLNAGFEKPRAYDWNGNKMFFSTKETNRSPRQAMIELQEQFVQDGVNSGVHRRVPTLVVPKLDDAKFEDVKESATNTQKVMDDFFGGGLVPTELTRDRFVLSGCTSKGQADNLDELFKELIDGDFQSATEPVAAMRSVEGFRTPKGTTRMTAVWSDEELDIGKIANRGHGLNVDTTIPTCVGCEREQTFRGEAGTEKDLQITTFNANSMSPRQVVEFYAKSLARRGYYPMESSLFMQKAKERGAPIENFAVFSNDNDFITLSVFIDGNGQTKAHLSKTD